MRSKVLAFLPLLLLSRILLGSPAQASDRQVCLAPEYLQKAEYLAVEGIFESHSEITVEAVANGRVDGARTLVALWRDHRVCGRDERHGKGRLAATVSCPVSPGKHDLEIERITAGADNVSMKICATGVQWRSRCDVCPELETTLETEADKPPLNPRP